MPITEQQAAPPVPGVTDHDVIEFTHGGCLILAEAAGELTGWPLCAFEADDYPLGGWHVFMRTPAGLYLDVEGLHTYDGMMDAWPLAHASGIVVIDPGDIDAMAVFAYPDWLRPRAIEIAPLLIELARVSR